MILLLDQYGHLVSLGRFRVLDLFHDIFVLKQQIVSGSL